MMAWIRSIAFAAAGVLAMSACASSDIAPRDDLDRPDVASDEAGLWMVMDKAERDLQGSSVVVRDEALNAYLRNVTCRVVGETECEGVRVYIVEQPYFNANMAPNGMMQVWTGLLLRAENEAQLAFVLGHEFAHYHERHSLEQWRDINRASNASLFFSLGVALAGVPQAAVLGNATLTAQLYGFGRDKEREADELGFTDFVSAGYEPTQAAAIWDYLIAETEASDSRRRQRQIARSSIFSSHPLTAERVETLQAYAEGYPSGERGEGALAAATAPFLAQWLKDDLVLRDFGAHLHLIDHKIRTGRNLGLLHYRRGIALQARRDEGDLADALAEFEVSVIHPDAPPVAWRALGEAYRRAGRKAEAQAAFIMYLDLAPNAPDRLMVESYLDEGV